MDYSGFLSIKGPAAPHTGTITEGPHKGKIEILKFEQRLERPSLLNDDAAMAPTRGTVYSLTLTKRVDGTSPLLMKAMCNGTKLDDVELELYEPGPAEAADLACTITLEAAYIHEIEMRPRDVDDIDRDTSELLESVCLVSSSLRWRLEPEGIEIHSKLSLGPDSPRSPVH